MVSETNPEATFTIAQMAAQSGMSAYTLRYYEQIGLIQAIPRDRSSGHRRYSADTIHIVKTLAHLRASGMSIKDMRRYIRLREYGDAAAVEQKALFVAHSQRVAEEIRQMTIRQRFLNCKVAYWEARQQGDLALAEQLAAENREIAKELK